MEGDHKDILDPGERIVWAGMPDTRLSVLSRADRWLIPFSILWEADAIGTLVIAVVNQSHNVPRTVLSVVLAVFGIHLTIGRIFARRHMRRRTEYLLTDRRVIAIHGRGTRSIESCRIEDVGPVSSWTRPGGVGTIRFGAAPFWQTTFGQTGLEALGTVPSNAVPVFADVPEANEVLRLFNELKAQ